MGYSLMLIIIMVISVLLHINKNKLVFTFMQYVICENWVVGLTSAGYIPNIKSWYIPEVLILQKADGITLCHLRSFTYFPISF